MSALDDAAAKRAEFKKREAAYRKAWRREISNLEFAANDDEFIDAVRNRDDFAKIAEKRVGKYPVFVGEGAAKATQRGTTVSAEAKAFVTNWLQEAYGVSLK